MYTFDYRKVSNEELLEAISYHQTWLSNKSKGERLTFHDRDLSGLTIPEGTDLSQSSIVNCLMLGVQASRVNFSRSLLERVTASYSEFSNTDFTDAFLRTTSFDYCGMYNAKFTRTVLSSVTFAHAGLQNTTFLNAFHHNTPVNPYLYSNMRHFIKNNPALRTGGRILYRTLVTPVYGYTSYIPGRTYEAPVFSYSIESPFHPGIHLDTLDNTHRSYPYQRIVRCYVRDCSL